MRGGYEDLFAGIYKQAVIDDYNEVCKKIKEELKVNGIDRHEINDYVNKNSEIIKDMVRNNVYKESQNWRNGFKTVKMNRDSINDIVTELVNLY